MWASTIAIYPSPSPIAEHRAPGTANTIEPNVSRDFLDNQSVKNLEKPGGNITGVSDHNPAKQQLELIKKLTPNVKTIGALYSSSEDNSKSQVEEFKKIAEKKGYKVLEYSVPSTNEIATTMNVMLDKTDAVWIPLDNTIASAFPTVVSAAKTAKKPIYPSVDTMVTEGGLASVVVDQYKLGVATGKMAVKVFEGKKVSQLPVDIFDKGTPVVNKKVAKELGIDIPSDILKKAKHQELNAGNPNKSNLPYPFREEVGCATAYLPETQQLSCHHPHTAVFSMQYQLYLKEKNLSLV